MEYELVRSRRRTVAIVIRRDGSVEVRAPYRTSKADIARFVRQKESWIAEKSGQMRKIAQARERFVLCLGSYVLFLGREYPLIPGEHAELGNSGIMVTGRTDEILRKQVEEIFRNQAKKILSARVRYFSEQLGESPSSIKITGAKTRWGSCSARRSISFSWRLLMAPPEAFDYVVVHELAHLKELNHSPEFWREVARILPDYLDRRETLKPLQKRLWEEGWL